MFRRVVSVLVLALVLAGAAPAAAADLSALDRWEGVWGWVVSLWNVDEGEGGDGDRGLAFALDGLTAGGDSGAGTDSEGGTGDGDRGAGLDPHG